MSDNDEGRDAAVPRGEVTAATMIIAEFFAALEQPEQPAPPLSIQDLEEAGPCARCSQPMYRRPRYHKGPRPVARYLAAWGKCERCYKGADFVDETKLQQLLDGDLRPPVHLSPLERRTLVALADARRIATDRIAWLADCTTRQVARIRADLRSARIAMVHLAKREETA